MHLLNVAKKKYPTLIYILRIRSVNAILAAKCSVCAKKHHGIGSSCLASTSHHSVTVLKWILWSSTRDTHWLSSQAGFGRYKPCSTWRRVSVGSLLQEDAEWIPAPMSSPLDSPEPSVWHSINFWGSRPNLSRNKTCKPFLLGTQGPGLLQLTDLFLLYWITWSCDNRTS